MSQPYISADIRRQVKAKYKHRCAYCLSDEILSGIPLTIDHIMPTTLGGANTLDNLCTACYPCNEYKCSQIQALDLETGETVMLFNPQVESWSDHFVWSEDKAEMIGLTAVGRATIVALELNRELLVKARRRWVSAGWHPPKD